MKKEKLRKEELRGVGSYFTTMHFMHKIWFHQMHKDDIPLMKEEYDLLREALLSLNFFLTGKKSRGAIPDHVASSLCKAENTIMYLSDGGYSRLYFDVEKTSVSLGTESTEKVKEKWEVLQKQAKDIISLGDLLPYVNLSSEIFLAWNNYGVWIKEVIPENAEIKDEILLPGIHGTAVLWCSILWEEEGYKEEKVASLIVPTGQWFPEPSFLQLFPGKN